MSFSLVNETVHDFPISHVFEEIIDVTACFSCVRSPFDQHGCSERTSNLDRSKSDISSELALLPIARQD
jgi:hypothetical protein